MLERNGVPRLYENARKLVTQENYDTALKVFDTCIEKLTSTPVLSDEETRILSSCHYHRGLISLKNSQSLLPKLSWLLSDDIILSPIDEFEKAVNIRNQLEKEKRTDEDNYELTTFYFAYASECLKVKDLSQASASLKSALSTKSIVKKTFSHQEYSEYSSILYNAGLKLEECEDYSNAIDAYSSARTLLNQARTDLKDYFLRAAHYQHRLGCVYKGLEKPHYSRVSHDAELVCLIRISDKQKADFVTISKCYSALRDLFEFNSFEYTLFNTAARLFCDTNWIPDISWSNNANNLKRLSVLGHKEKQANYYAYYLQFLELVRDTCGSEFFPDHTLKLYWLDKNNLKELDKEIEMTKIKMEQPPLETLLTKFSKLESENNQLQTELENSKAEIKKLREQLGLDNVASVLDDGFFPVMGRRQRREARKQQAANNLAANNKGASAPARPK